MESIYKIVSKVGENVNLPLREGSDKETLKRLMGKCLIEQNFLEKFLPKVWHEYDFFLRYILLIDTKDNFSYFYKERK